MVEPVKITEVKIRLAQDPKSGFIGWASCVFDGVLLLNNISIRQGENGGIFITFPKSKSKRGIEYPYFKPITQQADDALREAILSTLDGFWRNMRCHPRKK